MEKIVFIHDFSVKSEPFTTHEIIAEYAELESKTVARLIRKHMEDLKSYGLVGFEIRAVKKENARGVKYEKVYHLNEPQATLLITYLKNTERVRAFKQELVRQFFLCKLIQSPFLFNSRSR